jgi:NADPH:quinone reductase-like Zn-dependent oxidoreductase
MACSVQMQSLARNGRIAVIGLASGAPVPIDPMDMMLRNYAAVGVLAMPHDAPETEAAVWDRLTNLAEKEGPGPVRAVLSARVSALLPAFCLCLVSVW